MKTERVKLLEPHEHEGKPYQAGEEIELEAGSAKWLIELKRAVPAGDPKTKARASD